MINRQQFHLVEINSLLEWLHEAEAELAIFRAELVAVEFDVLGGTRNIAFTRPDPVADNAGAQHVAN